MAITFQQRCFPTCYGSGYISGELADWLADEGMDHVRGAPRHPQTQGKIERWHQTLKNRILLENYYLPGALEEAVAAFIEHYNHHVNILEMNGQSYRLAQSKVRRTA